MKLSEDYTQIPSAAARGELKGAALGYLDAQPDRAVWRNKTTLPGHLIATDNDANAGGMSFKQFLPEGVHLGSASPGANGVLDFFRKNFQPLAPSLAPAPPAKVYGEDYEVYGAAHCRGCNTNHDATRIIPESPATRFKLLQFAAEIASITDALINAQEGFISYQISRVELPQAPQGLTSAQKNQRKVQLKALQAQAGTNAASVVQRPLLDPADRQHSRWQDDSRGVAQSNPLSARCRDDKPTMLGLLMCGTDANAPTYVASSGSFVDRRFEHVARLRGYTVCTTPKKPRQTLAGGVIPDALYSGSRAPNAQEPGTCAAPRMISQAIKDGCAGPPGAWRMSEIWYWRSSMPASDLGWVPGLTAYSCATCQKLVPLFLCPNLTAS